MVGGTGRTSIIKITSQITSGNKSTASGRPQPQKLDEKGVLRRRLTSAALRRSRHNREPRLDQMPLPAVTRATQPHTHTRTHRCCWCTQLNEREEETSGKKTSLADEGRCTNTADRESGCLTHSEAVRVFTCRVQRFQEALSYSVHFQHIFSKLMRARS